MRQPAADADGPPRAAAAKSGSGPRQRERFHFLGLGSSAPRARGRRSEPHNLEWEWDRRPHHPYGEQRPANDARRTTRPQCCSVRRRTTSSRFRTHVDGPWMAPNTARHSSSTRRTRCQNFAPRSVWSRVPDAGEHQRPAPQSHTCRVQRRVDEPARATNRVRTFFRST